MGVKLAEVALRYGADDLHGTIVEEHIFRMAGGGSPQCQSEKEMIEVIGQAGYVPVQRDTFYQPIKVWEEDELTAGREGRGPRVERQPSLASA
jgi:aminodeoxyfutalosine synthase